MSLCCQTRKINPAKITAFTVILNFELFSVFNNFMKIKSFALDNFLERQKCCKLLFSWIYCPRSRCGTRGLKYSMAVEIPRRAISQGAFGPRHYLHFLFISLKRHFSKSFHIKLYIWVKELFLDAIAMLFPTLMKWLLKGCALPCAISYITFHFFFFYVSFQILDLKSIFFYQL